GCRIVCIGDYTDEVPIPLACARVEVEVDADKVFYGYVDESFQEIGSNWAKVVKEAKMAEREMTGEEEDPAEFVILNESRKEYIVTNHQDFSKVILSLICWSDDPSVSMSTNYEIYRGPWAWDRISILSRDEFEPIASECNDITERIYRIVRKVVKEDGGGRISF
ncbi:hypothetical protein EV182_003556, partial [Spiromyces aspiralis]